MKKTNKKPSTMIKIISKFNAQSYPLDETAIEITIEDLENIGISKCFDVEKNCVVDYTPEPIEE